MADFNRRAFLLAAGGAGLSACTSQPTGLTETPSQTIDNRVDQALADLYATIPGTAEIAADAEGVLVIPRIRRAGFWVSGAYGEGALIIGPAKVDYYSMSAAGFGFTFGAAEYNQALFFMTDDALRDFRLADGWSLGARGQVVVSDQGAAAGLASDLINRPIIEVVFGQRGLIADASFVGAKYNRIIR
jgi:lipid-binding SYLF domain-containing protein